LKFKTPTLNLVNPETFRFAIYYKLMDPGPNLDNSTGTIISPRTI
jgi:hypothetical protein